MRVYPATIRTYCFLYSLRSFAKTNSVKKPAKNPVSNTQTTHVAWETAPQVYCQRRYKMYVNTTNHTGLIFEFFVSAICYHQNYKPRGIYQLSARVSQKSPLLLQISLVFMAIFSWTILLLHVKTQNVTLITKY